MGGFHHDADSDTTYRLARSLTVDYYIGKDQSGDWVAMVGVAAIRLLHSKSTGSYPWTISQPPMHSWTLGTRSTSRTHFSLVEVGRILAEMSHP